MNKKIIAFDIGNVLYYVKNDAFLNALKDAGIEDLPNNEEMCGFINLFCNATDIGLISLEEFFNLDKAWKTEKEYIDKKEIIKKAWFSVIERCNSMMNFVNELLEDGNKVCLISNIGKDHAQILRQDPIIQKCDQYFSYEIGLRKPHLMFFDYVKREIVYKHAIPALDNIIYFDDKDENVEAAKKFFTAFKFNLHDYKTEEQAIQDIKNVLATDWR